MNKRKLLMSLILAACTFFLTMEEAHAQSATDITARINERMQRHKSRKAAASHLKIREEKVRHKLLFNADGTPKGYKPNGFTGVGKAGFGKNKNKKGLV